MIKSGRIKWAGHAARIGEQRKAYRVMAKKKQMERDHTQDLGTDRRILLKIIARTNMGQHGLH
jgi:hypothetical protein